MYGKMINEIENYGDLKAKRLYSCSSGSSYCIDLILTGDHITCIYHSGDCDEDIARHMELPEIKSQLDLISDETLGKWWDEFFVDDTPEEHASASRDRRLAWLLFDAAANAIDGYCYEYEAEKRWSVSKKVHFTDEDTYLVEPCDSKETAEKVAEFLFNDFLENQQKVAKEYGSDSDWETAMDLPGFLSASNAFDESISVEVIGSIAITPQTLEYYKLGLLPQ